MRLAKRRFRDRSASKRRASSQDRDLEFKISSTADRACVVEPVVRANERAWHVGCGAAFGAKHARGSPLTFGKGRTAMSKDPRKDDLKKAWREQEQQKLVASIPIPHADLKELF